MNPFLFHQPADEVEIGLAILNAVFPLWITRRQGVFDIGDSTLLQNLLNDIGNFLVLKNPAISAARKKPKLRDDLSVVACQASDGTCLAKGTDVTVKETRRRLNGFQPDSDVLADNLRKRDLEILAQQFGVNLEKPAKFFRGSEVAQHEDIGAQWRIDTDLTF